MSSIELDIPNKTDELDSKVQKFDSEIKKSLRVSCRENFNEWDTSFEIILMLC